MIPLLFLFISSAWAQTFNTTGAGTTVVVTIPGNAAASGTYYLWSDSANWSTGTVPAVVGGDLNNGQTVNIDHDVIYNMPNDLKINSGAVINLNGASFITPVSSGDGFGKSVFVFDGGTFNMCNAEFRLPIWDREDVAEVNRTDLSGNFETHGTVIIYNSSVDVAQNWTGKDGTREINGGCLRIGEDYKNEGANDSYVDTCISLGWHSSGNFDASSGRIEIKDSDILFRGTSGNFNVNIVVTGTPGVCVMGSIDNLDVIGNVAINDSGDATCPTWNVSIGNYCIGGTITDDTTTTCGTCIVDQFITQKNLATLDCSINSLECADCEDDVCSLSIDCSSTPASCDGNTPVADATILVTTMDANATCGLSGTGITYTLCDGSGNPIGSPVFTTNTSHTFTGLAPGSYKIKVEDAAGCTDECDITIDDECGDCTPAATCILSPIDEEGCAIPTAFTDPTDVFSGIEACGAVVTMTSADVGDTDVCGDGTGASFTRTYSLFFDGLEFKTCEQTIVISDITPPTIDCPTDPIDLGCNPTLPTTGDAESAVTTDDNCGVKSVVATAGDITGDCVKTQIFNVVVTDNCDNTANCNVTYTWISDTVDPSIDCPADPIDLGCNPTLPTTGDAEAAVTTDDNCGVKSVVATAGDITGDCVKTQIFNVVVTDNCDNTANCNVTYTWTEDTTNPTIDCPADPIDLGCNPTLPTTGDAEAAVTTDDNCGVKSVVATAGDITGDCVKTQIFNVVVTDNCDNTANCDVTYTWISDTVDPSIDCPTDPIDLGCNPTLPTTGDAEAAVTTDDNCGVKSVVATAGDITGDCVKTQIFNVVVTDNCDNTANCDVTYTWTEDTTNPTIDCPADPIDLGSDPTLPTTGDAEAAVTTDDNCGVKSIVATAGEITGDCVKTQVFNVVVTDNCDNTANCNVTYTWTIDEEDPSIECPADPIDLGCNPTPPTIDDAEAAVTTDDNCGVRSVIASAGTITGDCVKTQVFLVVVTDNEGRTNDCNVTYTWTVDTENPSIDCPVDPIDLGCNPTPPSTGDAEAAVTTDDNCEVKSVVATAGDITGDCIKTQIFNVVVTDICDNTANCNVTYKWTEDTINPSITCPVDPIDLGCNPTPPSTDDAEAAVTTDDNCGVKSVVATAGDITGDCVKTQVFNVVVTDNCDNTANCNVTYTWTVDTVDPSIDCPIDPIDLGCNPTLPTTGDAEAAVTTDDFCGVKSVVATAGDITGDCVKTQIFNVVVTDNCDNTANCDVTYTWTEDTTNPTIECPTDPIDLSCNPTLPTTEDAEAIVTPDDNCGVKSVVATAGDITGDCIKTQIFNVVVTDNCDNTANCNVTYTWNESQAPIISCDYPKDTDLGCNPDEDDIPSGQSLIDDGYITLINGCGNDSQFIVLEDTENITEGCERLRIYHYRALDICEHGTSVEDTCSVTFNWVEDDFLNCEIAYAKNKEFSDCFLTDDKIESDLWGWTTFYDAPGQYIQLLYAGAEDCGYSSNGTNVGYVVVDYTGSQVTITYILYEPYILSEANVYIGCDSYPLDSEGEYTADPDFYNYNSGPLNNINRYTVGPITLKNSNGFNLITQAVTCVLDCECSKSEGVNRGNFPLTSENDTIDCEDGALSIGSNDNSLTFIIYPVPFKDEVFINYKFNYVTDVIIEVFDIKGALLKRIINRDYSSGSKFETSLDFRNFSNQLFFVKLTTNKGTGIKKIVSF